MSTDTGKLLDVEVMSRYSNACAMHENLKLTDPAKNMNNISCHTNVASTIVVRLLQWKRMALSILLTAPLKK